MLSFKSASRGLLGALLLALSLGVAAHEDDERFGVLIMAHGGGSDWNAGVLESVEPLRERYPLEVAFGMADAVSLQEAVSKLEARGVRDIAVVRLFISGDSWFERTLQILGVVAGAPARPETESAHHGSHGAHEGHAMAFWRLASDSRFRLSRKGLVDAEEVAEVLLARARGMSNDPAREDVLILAHGPGDDEESAHWLEQMDARADVLRQAGFRQVKVATLREDWPEKRAAAEQDLRDFVRASNEQGRSPLVIPFRVHGFGPYAKVLEGLDYVADEQGLIPHPAIARWVEDQVGQLRD